MPKKKKTSSTKTGRPLTISIHGEDLDVEAKFSNSRLSAVLAETLERMNGTMPSSSHGPQSSIMEQLAEFVKSLRLDQIEVLTATLDVSQKLMFVGIMNKFGRGSGPSSSSRPDTSASPQSDTTSSPQPD